MIADAAVDQLAALAHAEACQQPPRSQERRNACHLWASAISSRSLGHVRRAVLSFGDQTTQAGALELLGRLAIAPRNTVTPADTERTTTA